MSTTPIRVLIIDDEQPLRMTLGGYLEDRDFDVSVTESAEKALGLLQRETFDVAIVDIRLPGMDGDALIVKAHQSYPDLKFVVYTGSMDYELPEATRASGISEEYVLSKPMENMSVMMRLLRDLMKA